MCLLSGLYWLWCVFMLLGGCCFAYATWVCCGFVIVMVCVVLVCAIDLVFVHCVVVWLRLV